MSASLVAVTVPAPAVVPHGERPIYVEYVSTGDQHHYDEADDTAMERRPIAQKECWIDREAIPATPPAPTAWPFVPPPLFPGGPVTYGVTGLPLAQVPGDAFQYSLQSVGTPDFTLMVPANYSEGAYAPTLRDSTGRVVPYNPGVWVADGLLDLVQFKYNTPQELGFAPPFTFDFWRYNGRLPSSGEAVFSVVNEGAGPGLVFDAANSGPGLVTLRTINDDPTPGLEGITVQLGPPGPLTEIWIGNSLTGSNPAGPPPGPPAPNEGRVFIQKDAVPTLQFRTLVAGAGATVAEVGDTIVIGSSGGGGGLTALANEGGGAGVFDAVVGSTANLRSLLGTVNGLTVTQNALTITIDNTLSGANLGAGTGLFAAKVGDALQFNSLAAGAGITVTGPVAGVVTIAATGTGGITGLANEGGGAGVFSAVVGSTANLRSLLGTANGLTVTQGATTITIDNTLTGANLGGGTALFAAKVGAALQFNSLAAGTGISVTGPVGGVITIAATASGGLTALANEGGGAGVFDAVVGTTANLRSLVGTANGATVTQTPLTIVFDNTLTGTNLGAGTGLFAAKVGAALQFNSLAAGAGYTITGPAAGVVTFAAAAGTVVNIANEGGGAGVFDAVVANTANLRSLLGTANGLTVTQGATTITIDNTLTGANLGTGAGTVFADKTGASLRFNSIAAGANISVGLAANTITVAVTGVVTALANEGGGAGVFDAVVGSTANLRSLLGTANGLTVTQNATTITIDNTLSGANLGAGTGVFAAKVGDALQFNSLAAGAGISVTGPVAGVITIAASGGAITALANEGGGAGIFDAIVGSTANLRSLLGTANGLTVTQNATTITIDNTLTGANVGAGGTSVFAAKSGASLQFNTFEAGVGIGLATVANTITISAVGVAPALANEGGGAEVFDESTAATLRTLLGTANGLTVTENALTITIDNTLTGANLGAGTGTVFQAKSGASLQFNSLAGTANGLTVSAPAAGTITIDNTLTGANLGTGAGTVFAAKSGASLQFNSIAAGANISVNLAANTITIAVTGVVTALANEGGGAQVYDTGTTATLRTLVGTVNGLSVTQNATTITIDNTLTGANIGAGTGTLFNSKTGASLQFNSLAGTANGLTVSAPAAGVVTIDNTLTGASLGTGTAVFSAKSGATLQFNSIAAGANISVGLAANTITIAATGVVTALANEGGGAGVFDAVVGSTANLRSLLGTANGLTVTQNATTITIDNTLTGANLGAGTGTVFSAKSGASLQFNSLAGTANGLTVSAPAANVITIDNTLTGANLGAGTGTVFSAKSGASLQFNSLAGTANGLTVSVPAAGVITINNSLTGANLGTGAGTVFSAKSGATLQFNSIAAGANISVNLAANTITIAVTGVVTTLANEGGGAQVFDTGTAATLRTLLGTANGLTVTQNATTITIDNTLTGANLGAGTGTVFSAKSGASLQFNSLAGTANGLTVSAPAANVITIDNTLTGGNLGAGSPVFDSKSGATLRFNSIFASTNIAVGLAFNNIAISTVASPTFTNVTLSGLTPNAFVFSGTAGLLTSTAAVTNGALLIGRGGLPPVMATLTGTANQVIVTNGSGTITLSLPQSIATTSNVVFGTLTLGAGTTAAPTRVNIIGSPSAQAAGPNVQYYTTSDQFPLKQELNYTHDNLAEAWDAYWDDVSWKSSTTAGNFKFNKGGSTFTLEYDSGVAAGSPLTWVTALSLAATTGALTIPNTSTLTVAGLAANRIVTTTTGGLLTTAAALTNGQLLIGSTGAAPVAAALTGTANQVVVTNGAGTITLSTPQAIATTSNVTFNIVTITSSATIAGDAVVTERVTSVTQAAAAGSAFVHTWEIRCLRVSEMLSIRLTDTSGASSIVLASAVETLTTIMPVGFRPTTTQKFIGGVCSYNGSQVLFGVEFNSSGTIVIYSIGTTSDGDTLTNWGAAAKPFQGQTNTFTMNRT